MLSYTKPYLSGIAPVTCIFAERGTYHLPRNSCEFLCFGGGGSKYVFFLSEAYVIVFVSVTYIFTITGTYHLPGGLPSRHRRSVFPGGEASDPKTQSSKAQLFLWHHWKKQMHLFFQGRHKKKTRTLSVSLRFWIWRREGDSNPRNP